VRFPGDRERVRWQASQLALEMLRRLLLAARSADAAHGSDTAPGSDHAADSLWR